MFQKVMETCGFRTSSGTLNPCCQYDERVAQILKHDCLPLDTGLRSIVHGVRVTLLTPNTGLSPASRQGSEISHRTTLILPCEGACERLVREIKSKLLSYARDLVLIWTKRTK